MLQKKLLEIAIALLLEIAKKKLGHFYFYLCKMSHFGGFKQKDGQIMI
jgi:hypothetical protein